MMKAKGMPVRFWGEEVTTAVFILNRAPTKALMSKDKAAAVIKTFKMRAKAESGKKLHVLRTDHGGEFTLVEFAAYYVD